LTTLHKDGAKMQNLPASTGNDNNNDNAQLIWKLL